MNVLETQVSCIEDQCSNLSNDAELLTVINGNLKGSVEPLTQVETGMDNVAKVIGEMSRDAFYRMDNAVFDAYVQKAMEAHRAWLETLHTMVTEKNVLTLQFDDTKCGNCTGLECTGRETQKIPWIWKRSAAGTV